MYNATLTIQLNIPVSHFKLFHVLVSETDSRIRKRNRCKDKAKCWEKKRMIWYSSAKDGIVWVMEKYTHGNGAEVCKWFKDNILGKTSWPYFGVNLSCVCLKQPLTILR